MPDWIKVEHCTPSKPEVLQLARSLGITRDDAFGKAMRFWIWLDSITVDGRVDGVASQDVDAVVGVDGFCVAMERTGWLIYDAEKLQVCVPNFGRHNGVSAKSRALKTRRQADWRAHKTVDAAPSTREEKRRIEKNKKKTPLPPSVPDELNTPEFLTAWEEWKQHRREIHEPLTETSVKKQLAQFVAWGIPRSIAAIEHTIRKGWQGLREPDAAKPNGKPKTQERLNAALEAMKHADSQ